MDLTIDGQPCDLGAIPVLPGYDAANLADIGACREGRSVKMTLPPTLRNESVVRFARDPHAAERFNAALHRAELTAGGAVLLAGTVRLLGASSEGYTLEIRDGGALWARNAAVKMFNTLGIDYRANLNPVTICQSWTNDDPVKFFPVHRDEYEQESNPLDLLPAERMLSVDDYHPFLHIATLVGAIFREAGYTLRSEFLNSEFFRSLYMSGAYASRDTTAADNRMGFLAGRMAPATAAADYAGRVAANPKSTLNSVGNIVETATPQTPDADGAIIPGLYNNGNCFSETDGKIGFIPPAEVSVGFEYYLKYTTDHRILSRTRLRGIDSVYLGTGAQMSFSLANRYEDRRGNIRTGYNYRVVVFDHAAGAQYRLTFTRNNSAGSLWTEFAARSASVTTPAAGTVSDPVLLVRSGSAWTAFSGDWTLYDGHIGETGQTTVELRVCTAAESITPQSPKSFDQIYFYGAEAGMTFTLHKACSLRPRFLSGPGYGTTVAFADVARHRIRQSVLLESMAHLFNLRFFTEQATRTVWVEPADAMFGAGEVVDWTDKTDFSQLVEISDIAPEVHERRTWCYQQGDGPVARFESETGNSLGAWSFRTGSFAAKEGEQQLANPLFRPSLSSEGHYRNAPSARIIRVGDRDNAGEDGTNFTPRIVRFTGMHPLPGNERWGHPWEQPSYPLAAFHFPGDESADGFTLCFEDRDGLSGLHRYYDGQLARESARQYITLSLRLAPHEFESLFSPGTGAPDIRSEFLIDTGSGRVRTTLRKIEKYDPVAASVRCTFTRLTKD